MKFRSSSDARRDKRGNRVRTQQEATCIRILLQKIKNGSGADPETGILKAEKHEHFKAPFGDLFYLGLTSHMRISSIFIDKDIIQGLFYKFLPPPSPCLSMASNG